MAREEQRNPGSKGSRVFEEVRRYCMAKEGVVEDYPWGDVVWKIGGKMFAAGHESSDTVTVKASLDDQALLIQHPNIEKAHYVGRFGWVTVTLRDDATFTLAKKLIDDSYEAIRPRGRAKAAAKPTKPAAKAAAKPKVAVKKAVKPAATKAKKPAKPAAVKVKKAAKKKA